VQLVAVSQLWQLVALRQLRESLQQSLQEALPQVQRWPPQPLLLQEVQQGPQQPLLFQLKHVALAALT
jgi:hypothetical protein